MFNINFLWKFSNLFIRSDFLGFLLFFINSDRLWVVLFCHCKASSKVLNRVSYINKVEAGRQALERGEFRQAVWEATSIKDPPEKKKKISIKSACRVNS